MSQDEVTAETKSKTPPPNPYHLRWYRTTCSLGAMEVSIPAPGNKLPVGEDANDLIHSLNGIIRQLERARDTAAKIEAQHGQ